MSFNETDTFELVIDKGENLVAADFNGFSDPYVKIMLNNVLYRKTQIRKKTLNPVWNETVTFYYICSLKDRLTLNFQVYDWDRFTKDVSLNFTPIRVDHCQTGFLG